MTKSQRNLLNTLRLEIEFIEGVRVGLRMAQGKSAEQLTALDRDYFKNILRLFDQIEKLENEQLH